MLKVKDILSKFNGGKYFLHWISILDIITYTSMMPQFLKQPSHHPFGKYEYLKFPFGLAQAPPYFQKLIDKVLKDLPFSITYLDDIIIHSKTAEDHLDHLQQVFHKL